MPPFAVVSGGPPSVIGSGRYPQPGALSRELPLSERSGLESQRRAARLIFVARRRLFDLRPGLTELRLCQFDNRAQSEVVAFLRQIERVRGLGEELVGQREALPGRLRLEPGDADVADHTILEILQRLLFGRSAKVRFRPTRRVEIAVRQRQRDVDADG